MLSKKTISLLIKFILVGLALYFLYHQFVTKTNEEKWNAEYISRIVVNKKWNILLVVGMMVINWTIEAVKWRFLIRKIEQVKIFTSIRAVFSGITISVFTPNRIGEYAGRVFCLEKADRVQAALITILGSMAQLLTTIFFGSIGLLFLNNYITEIQVLYSETGIAYLVVLFLLLLLNVLLLLLFHNISVLSILMEKYNWLNKYKKYKEVFTYYNSQELMIVFLLSVFRYIVFTMQFFLLLQIFEVSISYFDAMILTMVMLFVISIIPTIAITEISVRGSVALYLFSFVSSNTIGILSATFLLWVINLLIPAIIGAFFVFSLKFFRSK